MFVQVMEGKASDAAGLRRQMDAWNAELKPGATGFLGATGGVAADGRAVLMARFDSEESAVANSSRPEQGDWWSQTEKCFDGPVTFTESTEVDLFLDGGSDGAGFVQVMTSQTTGLLTVPVFFSHWRPVWWSATVPSPQSSKRP